MEVGDGPAFFRWELLLGDSYRRQLFEQEGLFLVLPPDIISFLGNEILHLGQVIVTLLLKFFDYFILFK